jgi:hypothetical protein
MTPHIGKLISALPNTRPCESRSRRAWPALPLDRSPGEVAGLAGADPETGIAGDHRVSRAVASVGERRSLLRGPALAGRRIVANGPLPPVVAKLRSLVDRGVETCS